MEARSAIDRRARRCGGRAELNGALSETSRADGKERMGRSVLRFMMRVLYYCE